MCNIYLNNQFFSLEFYCQKFRHCIHRVFYSSFHYFNSLSTHSWINTAVPRINSIMAFYLKSFQEIKTALKTNEVNKANEFVSALPHDSMKGLWYFWLILVIFCYINIENINFNLAIKAQKLLNSSLSVNVWNRYTCN